MRAGHTRHERLPAGLDATLSTEMSSASSSMYSLKPVVALPDQITLPKVMYELPKIQGGGGGEEQGDGSHDYAMDIGRQVPLPEYNILEARQMRILNEICELKEQIEYLCVKVRITGNEKTSTTASKPGNQKPINEEIIIYANPASPPYSILALQRIWKDTKFNVEVHRHSSASNASTNLFEEKLSVNVQRDTINTIDLKLIWKDVQDVQLVTKVYDYPIEGEANALRYLTRLIINYNYENKKSLFEANAIDTILDLCLRLPYEEPRYVKAILPKFSNHLDKNLWLLNSTEHSIVDVAVWSIMKRIGHDKVPSKMKNWYDLCDKTFLSA